MGLGLTDMLALYHLANEPLSAGELRDRVGLSTGSVTALVDRLIAEGLVHRRAHPTDRRAVIVEMTPDGHAKTFATMQTFIAGVVKLAGSLSAGERATVVHFLGALGQVIDDDTTRLRSQ